MPSLGELQLFESNAPCSGGAFLATRAFTVGFDRNAAGVSVHARKGTRWVVVKLQNQPALPDLLSVALSEAQQGSDLLARRGHFVELDTPNTDHLIWWLDANGPRLRASHLTLFEAPKVNLDLQVVRADGSEAPPPPPVPWHPLLRFYRFAHLAEDPIERFRYLYLAIENAISTISPKVPRERESVWLQRVLRAQAIDCASVLQGSVPAATNPVEHVVTLVYTQARLPAFHAKDGQNIFLPADSNAVHNAANACDIALRLLKAIAQSLGQQLGGSFVAQGGFELMTEHLATHARIHFSADTRGHDPADTEFSDAAHPATELATTTTTGRFVRFMRATLASPTAKIARVGLVADGTPVSATCYEAVLDTTGFSAVDFVLGVHMAQPGAAWTALPPA